MTARPCQFCGATATGTVTAGLASPILYCDADKCWRSAYEKVCRTTPRTWKMIEPPRSRRKPPAIPGQLDLLSQ